VPDVAATIGEVLVPHEASWHVVAEAPDGTRTDRGVWTDRFALLEHGEYRLLRFEQSFRETGGGEARHNIFLSHYPSLLPVHAELNLASGRLLTDYFGAEVHGTFQRTGQSELEPFREVLDRQVFDFAMSGYLALGQTWNEGDVVRAPFFAGTIDGSEGVRWIDLEIGATESLEFRGESVDTRVVQVPALGWRMWMVPRPPYVYRSEIPRSDGGATWYQLRDYSVAATAVTATSVRVGDLTFDVMVAGPEDGEPVVLLHGFPQTAYAYRSQMQALAAAGYRAIAPNQRGYSAGARPPTVADYAMPMLVGDVIGIARVLGHESFHLVGHDWGGAVAWVIAATVPDRVRTLTVLSMPHVRAFGNAVADPGGDQAERSAYFEVFRAPNAEDEFLAEDAAFLRQILADLPTDAVEVYVDALASREAMAAALNWYRASAAGTPPVSRAGAGPSPPTLLVTQPTLYIWGEADGAFGRGAAEATREYVTGPYEFLPLPGVGHWLPEHAADTVNAHLLEHLARPDRQPSR
jgi:pimeloyl-ACP methyl ester carboxylesterase